MFLQGIEKPETRILQQIKRITALDCRVKVREKHTIKAQHIISFGLCFFPTSYKAELLGSSPRAGFSMPFVSLSKERCSQQQLPTCCLPCSCAICTSSPHSPRFMPISKALLSHFRHRCRCGCLGLSLYGTTCTNNTV